MQAQRAHDALSAELVATNRRLRALREQAARVRWLMRGRGE